MQHSRLKYTINKLTTTHPGSVCLKSYTGHPLFNGLLSAPATHKRSGILDVLDNLLARLAIYPRREDTGEQGLELYAGIAKERA